ncbi:MAG: hypothetical protein R3C13_07595 [Hyphomonas sp.]|uniref:hypothetical protein n=1 Tax=Hyphomonas sp. TaxID=87 RepID=UPI0035273BC4
MKFLRVAVLVVGLGFLLPGFLAVFRTDRLAEFLSLDLVPPTGLVTVRVLIGAPYLAMAGVCIYTAIKSTWAWLVPIAATEGLMALLRISSGFVHGYSAAGIPEMLIETFICVLMAYAARQSAHAP